MTRKPPRYCAECRRLLPRDAGPNRRYCNSVCRSRRWRRAHRQATIYSLAVHRSLELMGVVAVDAYVHGQCPVCARRVPVRKRSDSVYCSKRCRTRAWRLRKRLAEDV